MTEVGEHFVFLTAEAGRVSGTRLLTRPVGRAVLGRDVLVAVDALDERHLLVPAFDSTMEEDQSSQGVTLASRLLRVDHVDIAFVDLHCRIPALNLVFERLADDVVSRLTPETADPAEVCRHALDDWRTLLQKAGEELSRQKIVGLVGELEVLRQLAIYSPSAAIEAWRGPSRTVHDFVRGGAEIEVKTTTSVAGTTISISNIDQLDPQLVQSLLLIVVHANPSETALSLDGRIDELVALGVPRGSLLERIEDAGYVYESQLQVDDRYNIRSLQGWLIDDGFPGLRSGEMSELRLKGVSRIHYELNLDAAPPRLSDAEFAAHIANWIQVLP